MMKRNINKELDKNDQLIKIDDLSKLDSRIVDLTLKEAASINGGLHNAVLPGIASYYATKLKDSAILPWW
ncbi:MAG: hypothetical protein AAGF26_01145 [Cyanobacteria bacterium P01_G01_bin.49]